MLESLIQYCQENKRVCPMPGAWNELWKMLPNKRQIGAGWQPPVPLILGAWWDTGALEKQLRFIEHLKYAESNGSWSRLTRFFAV